MPIAIVTGSDSGIGKATAVQLAQDGFDIGITWHEDERGAARPRTRSVATAAARRCGSSTSRELPDRQT